MKHALGVFQEKEFMKRETKFTKLPDPFDNADVTMDQFQKTLQETRERQPQYRPTIPLDVVNNPPHYTSSGIQPIEAIEAWGLGFNLGQVVKYVARAGKKDASKLVEDLQKAEFYLKREIANLQK